MAEGSFVEFFGIHVCTVRGRCMLLPATWIKSFRKRNPGMVPGSLPASARLRWKSRFSRRGCHSSLRSLGNRDRRKRGGDSVKSIHIQQPSPKWEQNICWNAVYGVLRFVASRIAIGPWCARWNMSGSCEKRGFPASRGTSTWRVGFSNHIGWTLGGTRSQEW